MLNLPWKFTYRHLLVVIGISLILAGCGSSGGSGDSSSTESSDFSVEGAAVKGPLINASVSAYRLDTNALNLKGELIALGSTNSNAQLELDIDAGFAGQGPFLLEFTNGNEIGGALPEIETLITLLTDQQLLQGTPVYATPLSTFAIEYAAKIADRAEQNNDPVTAGLAGNGDNTLTLAEFNAALSTASTLIRDTLGLGALDENIDLFSTSPLITNSTDMQQTLAIRTANEVFAAIVTELKNELAGSAISGRAVLERLAEDFTDGQFDKNSLSGAIAELNDVSNMEAVFTQDPGNLPIPGGNGATVSDLVQVLLDEIELLDSPVDAGSVSLAPIIIEPLQTSVTEPVEQPEPVSTNSPPVVSFSSPVQNAVFDYGQAISVAINAYDAEGSVTSCRLYVNGSLSGEDASAPFTFSGGTLDSLPAGTHSLQAACDDNQQLTGSSSSRLISVNPPPDPAPGPAPAPSAPVVTFAASSFTIAENSDFGVDVIASDADGSISRCSINVDGGENYYDSSAPYQWYGPRDAILTDMAAGTYTLNATCRDNDGLETSISETLVVEAGQAPQPIAPVVTFSSPVNGTTLEAGDNLSVAIQVSDPDSSSHNCTLSINGQTVRTDSTAPYLFGNGSGFSDNLLNNVQAGSHQLDVSCSDSDNLAGTASVLILVNEAPTAGVSIVLDWVAPSTRTDGTVLAIDEIDSFEIYYYLANSNNGISITVPATDANGSLVTRHQVNNVSSGAWLFSIATVDTNGQVSEFVSPLAVNIP